MSTITTSSTVQELLDTARITRFGDALKKQGFAPSSNALELLKLKIEERKKVADACGMKPGHRARFLRVIREYRVKAGLEVCDDTAKENEEVFLAEFLPVASFLSSLDSKQKPAIVEFLNKSADEALGLKKTFQKMDANKDGVLDEKEFVNGFANILKTSNKWLVPYLEFMCANPISGLPADELTILKTVTAYLKESYIKDFYPQVLDDAKDIDAFKKSFKIADSNKDGVIDEREYMTNVMLHLFASVDKAVLKGAKQKTEKKTTEITPEILRFPSEESIELVKNKPRCPPKGRLRKIGKRLPCRRGRPLQGEDDNANFVVAKIETTPEPMDWSGPPINAESQIGASKTRQFACKCGESKLVAVGDLHPALRKALKDAWLSQARDEHASVASFARHTLELLKFGAPATLVHAAMSAGQDEIRHAQMCFKLASRFEEKQLHFSPGLMKVENAHKLSKTLSEMAAMVADDGCVGETIAVLLAARQLAVATDKEVCNVLQGIVTDEAKHSALAWSTVAWAMSKDGKKVFQKVEPVLERESKKLASSEGSARKIGQTKHSRNVTDTLASYGVLSDFASAQVDTKIGIKLVKGLKNDLEKLSRAEDINAAWKKLQKTGWPLRQINEAVTKTMSFE